MKNLEGVTRGDQYRALGLSTLAFTVCFAVWTIFSVIGVKIQQDLGLSETQFGVLVATPILTGSISRIFLGIWTEQYGGRLVFTLLMLITAVCVYLLSFVESYPMFLLAALGIGLAGGSFIVGIAYTSYWFEQERQGTALGIFGAGNVGAAVTNFGAPFLLVAMGWERTAVVYATVLAAMAVVFFLTTKEDPVTAARRREGGKGTSALLQLEPLKYLQVWRFALYYFFVFGAFVALASYLPRYYVGAYGLEIAAAGTLAALYSLPASVFRALGGWLSDRFGARAVMYWTFLASLACLFLLSYPETSYTVMGKEGPIEFSLAMPLWGAVALTVVLGFFMSLGKAAVYKHIPVYYPEHVGSVGGLVGMIGGLGGFFLPIVFGVVLDLTGVWTSSYMVLFVLVAVSLTWMHFAIRRMERRRIPELGEERYRYLPEVQDVAPGQPRQGRENR
ncbi:MFS transporter [Thiohalorhabdus denitrificans]|uniref:MFS transporter, NNP family, nitrate/nitrite transporter n=1 Tax=Thiohalorhabdus denitrificans TaxID=381306 RepID=A0A0P9EFK9_9GAMM|nr:nitrate/nitrite transporter [Thiohalorhabdus denitrificans]KPV41193.1 MFS transporter [Thiohalorhabdus denitrificans]SCY35134.1 MFS transporter, NNP family, nitrate/nitrite transporter [Thiohalorhabdus denitrificans]